GCFLAMLSFRSPSSDFNSFLWHDKHVKIGTSGLGIERRSEFLAILRWHCMQSVSGCSRFAFPNCRWSNFNEYRLTTADSVYGAVSWWQPAQSVPTGFTR